MIAVVAVGAAAVVAIIVVVVAVLTSVVVVVLPLVVIFVAMSSSPLSLPYTYGSNKGVRLLRKKVPSRQAAGRNGTPCHPNFNVEQCRTFWPEPERKKVPSALKLWLTEKHWQH